MIHYLDLSVQSVVWLAEHNKRCEVVRAPDIFCFCIFFCEMTNRIHSICAHTRMVRAYDSQFRTVSFTLPPNSESVSVCAGAVQQRFTFRFIRNVYILTKEASRYM